MFFRFVQQVGKDNPGISHQWVKQNEISNHLQLAVVCTEDQNFLKHHGFDFESIKKAMDESEDGGRSRGASTISQQTAKNVFLWPTSSFIRKGFEAWFTILIEIFWGKQRILEVYLNSIEFGRGIYGCEAASEKFFHKHASQLSESDAAQLAVVLPNPLKFKVDKPSLYLKGRKEWAVTQMHFWGGTLKFEDDNANLKSTKK